MNAESLSIAAPYVIQTLEGMCDCRIEDGGCAGHALQFMVHGPDGVPVGPVFASEEQAEDYASDLNQAYFAGVVATNNPYAPAFWRRG